MRNGIAAGVMTLALILSSGCSSSGDPAVTAEALQDCGLAGLLAYLSAVERLGDVLQEIEGIDQDGVTVMPTGTANQFDFVVTLDLNGDGSTETTLNGQLSFGDDDPTDGVDNGETATLVLNQPSSLEASAVSANVDLTFTDNGASAVGTAAINGVLGCNVSATFPDTDPLVFQFNNFDEIEQRRLSVEFAQFVSLTGTAELSITSANDSLETTVMFSPTSQNINFSNNVFNELSLPDTNVDAPLNNEEFQLLQQCLFSVLFAGISPATALEEVLEAVGDGRTGTTLNGDEFTFTQVSGLTYDYSLRAIEGGLDATISGRVTFSSDPTGGNFAGTADISSWTFRARQSAPAQLAGFLPFFGDADGNSTGPMQVVFGNGEAGSVWGQGSVMALDGSCSATFNVPSTNPFILDEEVVMPANASRFEFNGTVDGIPVQATVISENGEFFDEVLVTDAFYDGIPIPGNLLEQILFLF